MPFYVGAKLGSGNYEKFWNMSFSPEVVAPEVRGKYRIIIGPFETEAGALVMETLGKDSTVVRNVEEAEDYAKKLYEDAQYGQDTSTEESDRAN